jgi:hypothetical protein
VCPFYFVIWVKKPVPILYWLNMTELTMFVNFGLVKVGIKCFLCGQGEKVKFWDIF